VLLTYLAMTQDERDPAYQAAVYEAERNAHRVKVLAKAPAGIPPSGAVTLLRTDPLTQGPKLFAKNCASCHRYGGHDGTGVRPMANYSVKTNDTLAAIARRHDMTEQEIIALNKLTSNAVRIGQNLQVKELPSAPDLKGFATRQWLTGLLDPQKISSSNYFGATKFANGKMAKFVKSDMARFTSEQKAQLQKVIVALSAEAQLKSQRELDRQTASVIAEGKALIDHADMRCTECHEFQKPTEDATGPVLTGYGSRDWLIEIIANPEHERFYGKRNDRMPAFGAKKILDSQAITLLADWLRGDWYEPAHSAGTAGSIPASPAPARVADRRLPGVE
jgi:ubiquinol-cytochrome c reductase cytochrome b subunit